MSCPFQIPQPQVDHAVNTYYVMSSDDDSEYSDVMAEVDQDWARIQQELSNPDWDFRTIDGLSKATGLPGERVADLIDSHATEVRKSNLPDKQGRTLYTLAARPMKFQEVLANTFAVITRTGT